MAGRHLRSRTGGLVAEVTGLWDGSCCWSQTARLTSLLCTRCFSPSQLKIESASGASCGSRTRVARHQWFCGPCGCLSIWSSWLCHRQCMRNSPAVLCRQHISWTRQARACTSSEPARTQADETESQRAVRTQHCSFPALLRTRDRPQAECWEGISMSWCPSSQGQLRTRRLPWD